MLKPEMTQQVLVLAHFSDGRVEDVTRWAKYTSTNESAAQVGDEGLVQVMGYGEGAITAWYLSLVVIATVSSPVRSTVLESDVNAEDVPTEDVPAESAGRASSSRPSSTQAMISTVRPR